MSDSVNQPGNCNFVAESAATFLVTFSTTILQFAQQGEKTGWRYVSIPAPLIQQINPGFKKSFRVKGKLDEYSFTGMALLPMGDGSFIMALNGAVRKALKKQKGARLKVQLALDIKPLSLSGDLMNCLSDEPTALDFFGKLAKSHQLYFSKWVETAKTQETKTKRIAQAVTALSKKKRFNEMLRSLQQNKNDQIE